MVAVVVGERELGSTITVRVEVEDAETWVVTVVVDVSFEDVAGVDLGGVRICFCKGGT